MKSLCNLSNRCSEVGRQDLSLEFLGRAFKFEADIDSVAYAQLGNEFLRLRQLERAESCYVKAQEMEHDPVHREQLVRKVIRVTVQRGKYSVALAEYDKLDDLWQSAEALTDRGVLLRKMGDLPRARESYRHAIRIDSKRHAAYAGLAEARKQAGKLERSIKSYNALFCRFSDLDRKSEMVYLLATSYLYRLTARFRKSRHLLDELIEEYPQDPDINYHLGTLLALTGQQDEGLRRLQLARKMRPSDELADELFSLAMEASPELSGPRSGQHAEPLERYMPEDRGLAACGLALKALMRDSFEEVFNLTEAASHVDKLHSDFALTLRCHAQKRVDPRFNYKTVQRMARIAKSGQSELRATMRAIAEDQFDEAIHHEKRMCLLLTT